MDQDERVTDQPATPPAPPRKPYATPRLTVHGTVTELTRATADEPGSGVTDFRVSDRRLKERFAPVDPQAIVGRVATLPIETWSYRGQDAAVRHMGPMAQDFAAAFGVGPDDRHIDLLDASGVALAAIQGLHQLAQVQAAELQALRAELRALRAEIRLSPAGSA